MAGLAYVVMFGAMFGDAGQGLLLVLGAVALRLGWLRRWHALDRVAPRWLFVLAAGIAATIFGLGYGEFFGPTGVVPTLWLAPMEHPVPLLVAGVALGAVLLGCAYALGTVNRVREGGWGSALYAPSGVAGSLLFAAAGLGVVGWYTATGWLAGCAAGLALIAVALAFTGFWAGAGRGASGILQAVVEVFDMVLRLGANIVSFARLAAFGLTHAVLGWIVWSATTSLWARGPAGAVAAVAVFVLGNTVTFALEALVAGVQALRLEYYELFSRVFQVQGRPFRPWHLPIAESVLEEK
jgi:V/A-type H+-transporting ATPase subunit I